MSALLFMNCAANVFIFDLKKSSLTWLGAGSWAVAVVVVVAVAGDSDDSDDLKLPSL